MISKMKRRHLVVILCVLTLFLASCLKSSQPSGAPRNPFIGGTQGLVVVFEEDSPPPEVTDAYFPFRVVLKLTNEGETDVSNRDVNIGLAGISGRDFNVDPSLLQDDFRIRNDGNILAKDRDPDGDIIPGGIAYVTIPPEQYGEEGAFISGPVSGNTPFTFQANVCYPYSTLATTRLCIISNIADTENNRICNPNGAKPIYSSSSPVQVSNLRQYAVGRDENGLDVVRFSFDVSHRGSGTVYSRHDTFGTRAGICPRYDVSEKLRFEDKVYVFVDPRAKLGYDSLECGLENRGNHGNIRLIGGKNTVTCEMRYERTFTDFESVFDIDVLFNYDQSIKREVLVKHVSIAAGR